ncbi:hypothetical protein ROZALSC1DRAFT_25726, partial [Rozella allomycis CSF55]
MNALYVLIICLVHLLSLSAICIQSVAVFRLLYSVIIDPKKCSKPMYPQYFHGAISAVIVHCFFSFTALKTVAMTNLNSDKIIDFSYNFDIFSRIECYVLANISYFMSAYILMVSLGYTSVLYLMCTQNIVPETRIRKLLTKFFLAEGKYSWINSSVLMIGVAILQYVLVGETLNQIQDPHPPFYISNFYCTIDLHNYRFRDLLLILQILLFSVVAFCCVSLAKIVLQARKKSLSTGAQSALKPQLIFRCVVIVVVNSLAGSPWVVDNAIAT